jgi:uncharacterized protein YheU (UPF0270 family)
MKISPENLEKHVMKVEGKYGKIELTLEEKVYS